MFLDVLDHLRPEVGGGNPLVGFMCGIVSSINSVMCLAHSFFLVSGWQIKSCPRVVEIV